VDSETVLSAPVRNTEALSAALRVELPLERERYLGKDVDRLKEIDIELRRLQSRGEFAPASLVVERLGVGERYLRTLASSGKLTRVKNKGLYAPASVFEYLKEEGRPIFN